MLAFIHMPSPMELLLLGGIVLLLFGSRIPSMMRSLGKSVPEFKKGLQDDASSSTPPRRED